MPMPIALSVNPPGDGLAFTTGMQAGQRTRINEQALQQGEQQGRMRDMQMRNSIISQAMEIGAHSPEEWDAAMDAAVEAGAPEAAKYKGQWSPRGARHLAQAYGGTPETALSRATGVAPGGAPSQGAPQQQAASAEHQYDTRVMQAIEQMKPEEREQKLEQYGRIMSAMNQVHRVSDIPALIDSLVASGIEGAEQFRSRYSGIDQQDIWDRFNGDYQHLEKLHNMIAERHGPEQFGMPMAPQQPKYDVHYGGKDAPTLITETPAGGGQPSISYAHINGAPPIGAGPDHKWSTEESNFWRSVDNMRQEFEQQNTKFMAVRDAYAGLQQMPDTVSGQMGLIYGIMKLFDPGSVVREGEYANAAAAQSALDRLRSMYQKTASGKFLSPTAVGEFKATATKLYDAYYKIYKRNEKKFNELASRRGFDPRDVVQDLSQGTSPSFKAPQYDQEPINEDDQEPINEDDLGAPPPAPGMRGRY